jgi:uncharacterized membrane protein
MPHYRKVAAVTDSVKQGSELMKRTLVASAFALAISLATMAPAAAAEPTASGPAAQSNDAGVTLARAPERGADTTAAGPLVTCNYRVWWSGGVNIHARKDRSSPRLRHVPANTVIYGAPCTNSTGGNYGSCGTGNLWKAIGGGWVATKCLRRV